MTKKSLSDQVATTIEMSRALRVQLDEVRVARAHRLGGLPFAGALGGVNRRRQARERGT